MGCSKSRSGKSYQERTRHRHPDADRLLPSDKRPQSDEQKNATDHEAELA
ncbi:MAG TPA: hypothetical protein VK901_10645 [Nitrospiraceae bacterium]|nr:hypothetical protein [Nitrospiraceae bacterium]